MAQTLVAEAINLSKRYINEWIIKGFSYKLEPGKPCALTGPNGSGKSTLLQLVAGFVLPTDGTVTYLLNGNPLAAEEVFTHISIAAPYMELLEEFTLPELMKFQGVFKKMQLEISPKAFAERLNIAYSAQKPISQYSSGMKQRVKLGLALLTDTPLLLLDEPCANLDAEGLAWYRREIQFQAATRTVLICSNQAEEYDFCDVVLKTGDYKHRKSVKGEK